MKTPLLRFLFLIALGLVVFSPAAMGQTCVEVCNDAYYQCCTPCHDAFVQCEDDAWDYFNACITGPDCQPFDLCLWACTMQRDSMLQSCSSNYNYCTAPCGNALTTCLAGC